MSLILLLKNEKGISLIEVLLYITIISIIILPTISIISAVNSTIHEVTIYSDDIKVRNTIKDCLYEATYLKEYSITSSAINTSETSITYLNNKLYFNNDVIIDKIGNLEFIPCLNGFKCEFDNQTIFIERIPINY